MGAPTMQITTVLRPALLLWVAFSATAAAGQAGGPYVDARDYPSTGAGWERLRHIEAQLVRDFDYICGDTFCEGDYNNLQALRLRCSVQAGSGRVHACGWTFTGSMAEVDAISGEVVVDAPTWHCRAPLAEGTPLERLLQTLEQPEPLHVPLPGTGESIYDGLVDCVGRGRPGQT